MSLMEDDRTSSAVQDDAVLEHVVARHERDLVAFASRLGAADPQHLVNGVFFEAWRSGAVDGRRSQDDMRAFLYRRTRSRVIDGYRRDGARPSLLPLDEAGDLWPEDGSGVDEIERIVDRDEALWLIDELEGAQREVIRLRFFDDLSLLETADRLGRSRDAISQLQTRALRNLRLILVAAAAVVVIFVLVATQTWSGQRIEADVTPVSERSAPADEPAIHLDVESVDALATLSVGWSGGATEPDAWLGLFPAGASNEDYVSYGYTSGRASGSIELQAPVRPGSYEIRLFAEEESDIMAVASLTVHEPVVAVLAESDGRRSPDDPVLVAWAAGPEDAIAWIGLYTSDAGHDDPLERREVNGSRNGTVEIGRPAGSAGLEVRAFTADGRAVATLPLVPTTDGSQAGVRASSPRYLPAVPVDVSWVDGSSHPDAWVGFYDVVEESYSDSWSRTGGRTSGSATLLAPVIAGTYEIRLFADDDYRLLASHVVTIVASSGSTTP